MGKIDCRIPGDVVGCCFRILKTHKKLSILIFLTVITIINFRLIEKSPFLGTSFTIVDGESGFLDFLKYNHTVILHYTLIVVLGLLNLFINGVNQFVKIDALLNLLGHTLIVDVEDVE